MFANASRFLCGGVVCLAVAAPNASAQSTQRITADVPFEFLLKGQAFPAGTYSVSVSAASPVITVRSEDRRRNIMFLTSNGAERRRSTEQPSLVFSRYGTEHVLAQVWFAGTRRTHELPKDSRTRELAKRFGSPPAEIVTAVLLKDSKTRTK